MADVLQIFHTKWVFLFSKELIDGFIKAFLVQAKHLGCIHAEWTINKDGHVR